MMLQLCFYAEIDNHVVSTNIHLYLANQLYGYAEDTGILQRGLCVVWRP